QLQHAETQIHKTRTNHHKQTLNPQISRNPKTRIFHHLRFQLLVSHHQTCKEENEETKCSERQPNQSRSSNSAKIVKQNRRIF
ncbi:hypothetical protein VIGAN_09008300, partial [Vigna angularis var. angularis]